MQTDTKRGSYSAISDLRGDHGGAFKYTCGGLVNCKVPEVAPSLAVNTRIGNAMCVKLKQAVQLDLLGISG
jgi:hypothetical protein